MLTKKQIAAIINTMMPFHPVKIGIFGSVARGDNTSRSDVDILYSFDSRYSLFDLAGIQFQLREKLKKEVDLVEFSAVNPKLKNRILSEVKMIYERE